MLRIEDCLYCGSRKRRFYVRANDRLLGLPGDYEVYECSDCGLLFLDPQPDAQELARHYPRQYSSYESCEPEYFARYERIYRAVSGEGSNWLKKLLHLPYYHALLSVAGPPGARVLDVGCGSGHFLALMKRALNFDPYGVDPFCPDDTFAKKHRLNTFHGTLTEARFPSDFFDIVTLNHVLEHLPDPRREIREIRRVLKAGGTLVIGGPNSRSFLRYAFGRHWANLDIPRHLAVPSVKNLKRLCVDEHFLPLGVRYYGGAEHLLRSILYLTNRPQPLHMGRTVMLAGLPFAYVLNFLRISDVAELTFTKPVAAAWIR